MRSNLFGNLDYTKHDTDGVGVRFFYLPWLIGPKPNALSFRNSNVLAFFNQGAPKQILKAPTINVQWLSKEGEQNSTKISCFDCPLVIFTYYYFWNVIRISIEVAFYLTYESTKRSSAKSSEKAILEESNEPK